MNFLIKRFQCTPLLHRPITCTGERLDLSGGMQDFLTAKTTVYNRHMYPYEY